MQIIDIITSPWAILPEKLTEIKSFYAAYSSGEKIDIAAIEARIGRPLVSESQGYQVVDGVAVIPVNGVIGKRMNMMTQISGGASSQLVARDVKAAIQDPNVNSILLHIDSPGGAVDGTQNLSSIIRAASTQKPTVAYADGTMASAAYWVGSSATEIVAASDTTNIGSIGILATHTDVSKAQESEGVKTTEITAGKYKRITSQYAPLSKEGAAHIQDQVDQIYTIFVDAVAENRGVDSETVLENMADGRVFLAREAMSRGMIDHIASLEQTIFNMSTGVWPVKKETQTIAQVEPEASVDLTIETVKEKYPEIAQQLMNAGAESERARIMGCEEATLPGHESLVSAMKYDGKSTPADVAMAIISAEKQLRASHHQEFVANAPKVVPFAPVPAVETAATEDKRLPIEERAKVKWDSDAKLRAEFSDKYSAFLAFSKAEEAGEFRILNTK